MSGRKLFLILLTVSCMLFFGIACGTDPLETEVTETEFVTEAQTEPVIPSPALSLAGKNISSFRIQSSPVIDPVHVQTLRDFLTSAFALSENEDGIVFDLSLSKKLNLEATTVIDGNTVSVCAGSNEGIGAVLRNFIDLASAQLPEDPSTDVSVAIESCVEDRFAYTVAANTTPAIGYILKAHTDKEAISYNVGDTVTFYFSLTSNKEVYAGTAFQYYVKTDYGYSEEGSVSAEDGTFCYTMQFTDIGYAQVTVVAQGYKSTVKGEIVESRQLTSLSLSACANFDQIDVSTEEPADFDIFWKNVLSKLDSIPPDVIEITEYKRGDAFSAPKGYKAFHVQIQTHGAPAVGFITYPEDAQPGTLGIQMIFNGYGPNRAEIHTDPNYICFNVCAHSIPSNISREAFNSIFIENNLLEYAVYKSDYDDPYSAYFTNMILRDVQALRYAETLPYWDGKTVYLIGGSQGGFQSVAVASLCPEVTKVTADISWMCNLRVNVDNMIPSGLTPEFCDNVLYFDTVYLARRLSGIDIDMSIGLTDPYTPPYGTTALYNNLKGCNKQLTMYQSGGHGGWSSNSETFVKSANEK